jgi:putative ABC transport system permease protein
VALSFAILTVAGLSIREFVDVRRAYPGFRTDRVLLLSFDPSLVGYDQHQMMQFYDQIVRRTKAIAGVEAVGLAQAIPLRDPTRETTALVVDGYDMPRNQETLAIRSHVVDSGYWSAMRTRIVRGRAFDDRDTSTSPHVIIVNETMARRYWPNQDAVGKPVHLNNRGGLAAQVVGVAEDGKYDDIAERQQPALFIPFAQKDNPWMTATMIVQVRGDPANFATPIRSEVKAIDANMPVFNVRSFERAYEATALSKWRLLPQIMIALAVLGVVIAVVGLYGVIAYLTAFRTREIGIRMALGADRQDVLRLVLKQAAGMVSTGLIAGVALAFAVTPAFASVFEFVPHDGAVLVAVSLIMIVAAFSAALIPARRAAMLHPAIALRDE